MNSNDKILNSDNKICKLNDKICKLNYKKYIIEKIFLIKQLFLQYNIINPGLNILHYITIIDYEDPIKTLFKKIIYDYENKNIKENKNNIIKNLFSYKKIYNFEIPEILLKNLYVNNELYLVEKIHECKCEGELSYRYDKLYRRKNCVHHNWIYKVTIKDIIFEINYFEPNYPNNIILNTFTNYSWNIILKIDGFHKNEIIINYDVMYGGWTLLNCNYYYILKNNNVLFRGKKKLCKSCKFCNAPTFKTNFSVVIDKKVK